MSETEEFRKRLKGQVVSIDEECTIMAAAQLLDKHSIGSLLVMKDDAIVGIVTERDIVRRVVAKGIPSKEVLVKDIMTRDVITVDVKEGIKKIFDILRQSPFRHLPITDNGKPIGVVSKRDLLYLLDK